MSDGAWITPAYVATDNRFSIQARFLAGKINALSMNENGFCWASDKYLADQIGVSERTVRRYLKELTDFGYLHSELHTTARGTERRAWISNPREPTPPDNPDRTPPDTDADPPDESGRTPPDTDGRTIRSSKRVLPRENTVLSLELDSPSPDSPAVSTLAKREDFEDIWQLAPGRGSKKRSWDAYRKVVPSQVGAHELHEARLAHVDEASDLRFVKHLERWIRDERWKDYEEAHPHRRKLNGEAYTVGGFYR